MATADTRHPHPRACPNPVALNGFVGIGGAAGQIAALPAKHARQRQLIEPDRGVGGPTWRKRAHDAEAASAAPCRAAIWPSASATASKVNSVEAWRAL